MYEITMSKSFANQGKRHLNKIKILPEDPLRIRKWYTMSLFINYIVTA